MKAQKAPLAVSRWTEKARHCRKFDVTSPA